MEYLDDFNAAPPGHSLTLEPGSWDWDKPPKFSRPDMAIEAILDHVEQPPVLRGYIKMMYAGISIEEIVNAITIAGFSGGMYTPDVAEIVKMPLAIYFMGVAEDNQIPVRVFMDTPDGGPPQEEAMADDDLFEIMKERNPDLYEQAERAEQMRLERNMQETNAGMLADIDTPQLSELEGDAT